MNINQLLQWQWQRYHEYHQSSLNLWIHILAVPLFMVGTIGLIWGVVNLAYLQVVLSLALMVVAVAVQGRGHKQEPLPPEPFTSPWNVIARIFLEQWITFPRFVLSGGWLAALRQHQQI